MKGAAAAVVGSVVALLVLALAAAPLALVASGTSVLAWATPVPSAGANAPAPSGPFPADIPPEMQRLYIEAAGRCPGLPWVVLAAIGKVETNHGRGTQLSSAGAEGPMQFLPSTWAEYAVDGNGDGVASVWDPADAIAAAADYLCANGGGDPARLDAAIFQYNHDSAYVRLVLAWAARYANAS